MQESSFTGSPSFDNNLTFNQWNPSWGTLNSVQISLAMTAMGGELRVDNDSTKTVSTTFSFGAQGFFTSDDVSLFTTAGLALLDYGHRISSVTTSNLTINANDGDADVGGTVNFSKQGSDYRKVTGGTVTSSNSGLVGSAYWTAGNVGFLGAGTYNITLSTLQYANLGTLGGAQQQIDPLTVTGLVAVAYDYSGDGPPPAVPEPSSLLLIGGIGVPLALLWRRHRKTARRI